MTKMFLILLLSLQLGSFAHADSSLVTNKEIPQAVSAVFISPEYSSIIAKQTQIASTSGLVLRIDSFDVVTIGDSTFAYIFLATKFAADLNGSWTQAGSIVGNIQYGPMGEVLTDGVYFKPAEAGPGGASVGNN